MHLSAALNVRGRAIDIATAEWRNSGRDLIGCLRKFHILRPLENEVPGDPDLSVLRAMALSLLYPILSESYSASVPKTSVLF